ncbi:putative membrane protein (DUF2142) [Desulfocapsa sulfexigens DSM 10523]|uniref:Putative membrane protein (DUF2142) n=1 Tax=Desulfocapsa sulfexigens (strain DSM 10523 / SB164P1) TaxID=1167006 RepID=M1PRN8_DESSD|nr:DUF2142 domain-containing protein [Desulfocapsa sulfexigens]AGF79001.1 putative membrane protein (DUF2142) [Desulfocapsa sulfexigens DSM 10523]
MNTILKKWKFPIFLGVLLSVLYVQLFENRAFVELDITVTEPTLFKIYWAEKGQFYSEDNMVRVKVNPEQHQYGFYLTDIGKEAIRLRIDPQQYVGLSTIKKIDFQQTGYALLSVSSREDFAGLQPIFDIQAANITEDGLETDSTGVDPQFEYFPVLESAEYFSVLLVLRIASIFLLLFLFFSLTESYREEDRFFPLLFAIVLALVVAMAMLTRRNIHPDEYVHLDAAKYYSSNWIPPDVTDPQIAHTYSVYGVSRLNGPEVAYFLNGKFSELISVFPLPDYLTLRIFNLLLFTLLLLYILKIKGKRYVAAPLLISPQIWYVFSYCNSDAFALLLTFFIACQLAIPASMLNLYLLDREKKKKFVTALFLVFVFAAMFLLKKNYWFFIAFAAAYFLWRLVFIVSAEDRKQVVRKMTILILFALSVTGLRVAGDYAVNGWDRSEKLSQIREQLAHPFYKPSTPLEEKHPFLYRKARGASLKEIVVVDRWFERSYQSAFGIYGYFTATADDTYYDLMRPLAVVFFMALLLSVLFRGGLSGNILMFLFLGCSGAVIAASLYHSWTADFQPQGRYLLPMIPALCIVLYHSRNLMQNVLFRICLMGMFLLSTYSFLFVGMMQLTKM